MKTGDRVRVQIKDYDRWAKGVAECLDGKTGVVEEVKGDGSGLCPEHQILVRFDTPAEKWWKYQTPATAHWFKMDELISVR